jgi:hypothetical protein
MAKEKFTREEIVGLYNNLVDSVKYDQNELKQRHFNKEGKVLDINDPAMNLFAGKIAGKTEFVLELANFIEFEPAPDTIEGIDKV